MTFTESIIVAVLIFIGSLISIGVIYKIFFKTKIIIVQPTPKRVVVERR